MTRRALVVATEHAEGGSYESLAATAALAVAEETRALVDELRTLNLLLAGSLLHDAGAGEMAARRLGLMDERIFEDGQG